MVSGRRKPPDSTEPHTVANDTMLRRIDLPGRLCQVTARRWLTLAVLACGGGRQLAASAQSPSPVQPAASSKAARAEQHSPESRWNVLDRSAEDRVIEYRHFGQGEKQVLVVGPLEGDETAALELIERLAEHLDQFPRRTDGVKVTLVRDPNPDGRLRRSPYNARGVRLDQNFPTRGWHKVPAGANWLSGREPESEPETRALVDLFVDARPDRVIILATSRRQAELTYFGAAEEMARAFAMSGGLRPAAGNIATQHGSLAVYTGVDRKTPTIVLRVPAAMRRDQLWATYKRALLATIGGHVDGDNAAVAEAFVGDVHNDVPTMLATAKRAGQDNSSHQGSANVPRILSADELQADGELVPVVRPPATSSIKPFSAAPSPGEVKGTPPTPRTFGSVIPPATLYRRNPTAARPLSRAAPPKEALAPQAKKVDRLPAVDPASSTPKTLPQPIPLYPETGL
jgi:hypothetical protein